MNFTILTVFNFSQCFSFLGSFLHLLFGLSSAVGYIFGTVVLKPCLIFTFLIFIASE